MKINPFFRAKIKFRSKRKTKNVGRVANWAQLTTNECARLGRKILSGCNTVWKRRKKE